MRQNGPDGKAVTSRLSLRTAAALVRDAWLMRIDEIKLLCHCGQRLRISLRHQGKLVQCPICGTVQNVPPDEKMLVGVDMNKGAWSLPASTTAKPTIPEPHNQLTNN
ncbi:MAG: hypothetical protein HJJLKODD_02734 [Phycisphaerae bacterium]|nr:hypothetical protein [Phycisphaerae bacterium]